MREMSSLNKDQIRRIHVFFQRDVINSQVDTVRRLRASAYSQAV